MISELQAATDAYWAATTPEEERIAYAAMRKAGAPPAYGEGVPEPIDLKTAKLTPIDIAQDGYEVTTADGIWIKQYVFPVAGSIVPQHAHVWDHSTALVSGAMFVWRDGVLDRRYEAPSVIFIKAGVKHTFQTVENDTVILCLHNAMRPDVAAVLDEHELEFC